MFLRTARRPRGQSSDDWESGELRDRRLWGRGGAKRQKIGGEWVILRLRSEP